VFSVWFYSEATQFRTSAHTKMAALTTCGNSLHCNLHLMLFQQLYMQERRDSKFSYFSLTKKKTSLCSGLVSLNNRTSL